MSDFDPNAPGAADAGVFGLPYKKEEVKLVLIPVPWEVTTSYGGGTSHGPDAILRASRQVDLFDYDFGDFYRQGIYWVKEDPHIYSLNERLRPLARHVIDEWESAGELSENGAELLRDVNSGCEKMVEWVYQTTKAHLADDRLVGLVGGDHSTPLGAIRAVCEKHENVGILHIDAHADLRNAYEGFIHSHASIMYNVMNLKTKGPTKLVQLGIRDFCQDEFELIEKSNGKIKCFFDREIKKQLFAGISWDKLCQEMISHLPDKVYISFDIDGLSPEYCPHTGTPVPGGLSFDQAMHLLVQVGKSGKQVVGFDLNEVAPGPTEWDANVGARVLFKLCGTALQADHMTKG